MKSFRTVFDQLDQKTLQYLRHISQSEGKGCPGIVEKYPASGWGMVPIVTGFVVFAVGLVLAWNSNKNADAIALLLAATALLGSWLIWFGLRDYLVQMNPDTNQRYIYCDPLHVYLVDREQVAITSIQNVRQVEAMPNQVSFVLDHGRFAISAPLPGRSKRIASFYQAILLLKDSQDPQWQNLRVEELGLLARELATTGGQIPSSRGQLNAPVDLVSESPHAKATGWLSWTLIASFAGALLAYVLALALFQTIRDDELFEAAKSAGAPGLRTYLIDERNTAHRDEAWQLLATMYDAPIQKIRTSMGDSNIEFRDGLIALLESLRNAPQPIVSIQVVEQSELEGKELRESELRTGLADGLGLFIGRDLIGFVKNPENQNAHVEMHYTIHPNMGVSWSIGVRPGLDQPLARTHVFEPMGPLGFQPRTLIEVMFQTLFRQSPPAMPVIPEWD